MTHTLYKLFPSRRFLLNFMSYTFNTVRILQRIPRFRDMSPEMETMSRISKYYALTFNTTTRKSCRVPASASFLNARTNMRGRFQINAAQILIYANK